MLQILERYKTEDIRICAPLSYGDPQHALKVVEAGKAIFGNKFVALTNLMPVDAYLIFLTQIDIAIFNHRRQQAMGNTITLLGLGKKVFMRAGTTHSNFLNAIGVKVFDTGEFSLESISFETKIKNAQRVKNYFSKHNLIIGLQEVFG